MKIADNVHKSM